MRSHAYIFGLSLFSVATDSNANNDNGVAFSISSLCDPPQFGTIPSNLSENLESGYNYGCYEVAPKALRWRTADGIPEGLLDLGERDVSVVLERLKGYAMQTLFFLGPLGGFVILSTLYCSIWSCGMMKCCAENRKCCGRCCANPPSFTEGKCEYALFLLIILSGAAIVALALHGLANQAEQKEAVDKFGSSFSLMQTLSHSTLAKIGSLENEIDALDATTDALAVTLGALRTTEIQADVDTALGDVYTGISGASNAVLGMGAHLTLLDDQISNMTASVSEAAATFNTYRGTAIACVWISLCGLILWNVLAAIVRQLAPAATDKCGGLFGFFGFIYLVVMFLLGVVCIALSILSILLGDICQDPKSHVATIVSSLAPSDGGAADAGGSGSGWGSGFEGSGDGGASLQGANAFLYYVDCDTNSGSINPFNAKVEETAEMVYRAAGGSEELLGIFGSKQADVVAALAKCTAALPAGSCGDVQTAYDNLFRDRAATQIKLSSLSAAMNALKANAIGKSTLTAASAFDLVVPVQGLDDGLFSAMHCYRMNARYHAVVNLFCSDVFSGMAATLEFLLVAFGLMVLVELLKRLARPYDASYTVVGVAPVDKWAIAQGRDKWAIAQGRDSVSY